LQDAVPITLGQVINGWVAQIDERSPASRRRSTGCIGGVRRHRRRHRPQRASEVRRDRLEAPRRGNGQPFPRDGQPRRGAVRPRRDGGASGALRTLAAR
jgi:hypothetical protein